MMLCHCREREGEEEREREREREHDNQILGEDLNINLSNMNN